MRFMQKSEPWARLLQASGCISLAFGSSRLGLELGRGAASSQCPLNLNAAKSMQSVSCYPLGEEELDFPQCQQL